MQGASTSETPPFDNPNASSIVTRNSSSAFRAMLSAGNEDGSLNGGDNEHDVVSRAPEISGNLLHPNVDNVVGIINVADAQEDESVSEENDSLDDDESVLSQQADSVDNSCDNVDDIDNIEDNLENLNVLVDYDDEDDDYSRYSLDYSYRATRSGYCSHREESSETSTSSPSSHIVSFIFFIFFMSLFKIFDKFLLKIYVCIEEHASGKSLIVHLFKYSALNFMPLIA